jgi:hypothetical protein
MEWFLPTMTRFKLPTIGEPPLPLITVILACSVRRSFFLIIRHATQYLAEEPTESMITEMRSLIGSIGYCATGVRFDISHAVSVLSRHLARPCTKIIEAAKRIIKYV